MAALLGCAKDRHLWRFSTLSSLKIYLYSKRLFPDRLLYSLVQISSPLGFKAAKSKYARLSHELGKMYQGIHELQTGALWSQLKNWVGVYISKVPGRDMNDPVRFTLALQYQVSFFFPIFFPNTFENNLGIWARRSIMFWVGRNAILACSTVPLKTSLLRHITLYNRCVSCCWGSSQAAPVDSHGGCIPSLPWLLSSGSPCRSPLAV